MKPHIFSGGASRVCIIGIGIDSASARLALQLARLSEVSAWSDPILIAEAAEGVVHELKASPDVLVVNEIGKRLSHEEIVAKIKDVLVIKDEPRDLVITDEIRDSLRPVKNIPYPRSGGPYPQQFMPRQRPPRKIIATRAAK
jgi:hypothetical protein